MTPNFKVFLALVLCAILAFLLSTKANAQEGLSTSTPVQLTGVGIHIGSRHWPSEQWNNHNPGVYVIGQYTGPGILAGEYAVGTFYNSERNQSVYISRNFNVVPHFDLAVGAITGYRKSVVLPLLAPSVWADVASPNIRIRLTLLPKVSTMPWVAHLSIERRF